MQYVIQILIKLDFKITKEKYLFNERQLLDHRDQSIINLLLTDYFQPSIDEELISYKYHCLSQAENHAYPIVKRRKSRYSRGEFQGILPVQQWFLDR